MTQEKSAGAIDRYLNRLFEELALDTARKRRILAEAEDHLHEAAEILVESGMSRAEAKQTACERFGEPQVVARRFAEEAGVRLLPVSFNYHFTFMLARFAGIGFFAIGLSGVIALLMGTWFGKDFVSGDVNGVTYTAERCADFLKLQPDAPDCATAATLHHFDEAVYPRLDAGILGILILVGVWVFKRRYRYLSGVNLLPWGLHAGIGMSAFGLFGAGLLLLAAGRLVTEGTTGAGAPLSGAVVSLVVFALYAWLFFNNLRKRAYHWSSAGPAS